MPRRLVPGQAGKSHGVLGCPERRSEAPRRSVEGHIDLADRSVAEELAEAAHGICPYSKAVHGNIEVSTNVI